jgi:hypothetical protein
VPEALGGVAGALGVVDEPADLIGRRRALNLDPHDDLLEVRRGVVDVVLLGVAKGPAYVGRGVVDRCLVERREPRQLGQQSKGDADHQVLER